MHTIVFGGWYQRTTLHLSEVYDFLAHGKTRLGLSRMKLDQLQEALELTKVSREADYLEFVRAKSASGIEIRYYEDGLYILELKSKNIPAAKKALEAYFESKFNPAISYIFSLGAPTPKILANIKTEHPTVVVTGGDFVIDEKEYGEVYSRISTGKVTVHKTGEYIFVTGGDKVKKQLVMLAEMQIFFREFKDQLEKYLNIHRTLWEEISAIKEEKTLRGSEVEGVRGRLDSYQKTISLISNRINQMGSYINTRSSIAKHLGLEGNLIELFSYKFETLADTLSYIKEIWKMTSDYIASAIQNLVEIKGQSASNNLKSLQTITSIGVISGVLGYLSGNNIPRITAAGALYFIILFGATWFINFMITRFYKRKEYSLRFGDRSDF